MMLYYYSLVTSSNMIYIIPAPDCTDGYSVSRNIFGSFPLLSFDGEISLKYPQRLAFQIEQILEITTKLHAILFNTEIEFRTTLMKLLIFMLKGKMASCNELDICMYIY